MHKKSGIFVPVSDADWSDINGQVADAIKFLRQRQEEMNRIAAIPGLSWFVLDSPSELRIGENNIAAQTDSFPAELLLLAGSIGLGVELTTYG